jgi:hypothetical protein
MITRMRHDFFGLVLKLSLFILTINMLVGLFHAQEVVPGAENPCVANFGYNACTGARPLGPQAAPTYHWAAIAMSASIMTVGAAHGRASESEAEETAIQNCHRNGAKDCKVMNRGTNCVAIAISYPEKAYGYDGGSNRVSAASIALTRCRNAGGKSCFLIATPCGGDPVQWSSPLPLPIDATGGKVDPALVGTWIMIRNPGQWVWRVAGNGTYEFHSEAPDNTPSNNGTLTANGGHYTLRAISMTWEDVGTYVVQSAGTILATGKLGTGTWKRAQ